VKSDLSEFRSYLLNVRGLAYGTTNTYLSNLRLLLSAVEADTDARAVLLAFGALPERRRVGVRVAWTAYVQWCSGVRPAASVPILIPSRPEGIDAVLRSRSRIMPPPELTELLRNAARTQPALRDVLPTLRWAHVTATRMQDPAGTLVVNPDPRGIALVLSDEILDALREWCGNAEPAMPLFPTHPGAEEPVNAWTLRTLLA
jgi:hypothetical protein